MKILSSRQLTKNITIRDYISLFTLILLGALYINFIFNDHKSEQSLKALKIARSVEASLSKESILKLTAQASDTSLLEYKSLKTNLNRVVKANPLSRFAYLYLKRDGKIYFMVDSELEDSPELSPPGQEYTEASEIDFRPFESRTSQITEPVIDRWGNWVSVEIPVINIQTNEVIAVLGIDYNADNWNSRIILAVLESSFLVLILIILLIGIRFSSIQNKSLKDEIQNRIQIEEKLISADLQLANLIKNLPGIAYRCNSDENHSMLFISESCQQITGYTPDDFVWKKSVSIYDLIVPEHKDSIHNIWQSAIKSRNVFEAEYPIRTASGEVKWLWERAHLASVKEGETEYLEGYIEDITDRKNSSEKLSLSEESLTRTIEKSPFGIRIITQKGETIYANPTLLKIFGYSRMEDFNQIPVTHSYLSQSYVEHLAREKKREKGIYVEPEYEISISRFKNEIRHLQVFRNELLWNGQMTSQIIYLDISDRKLAEAELLKLSKAIENNPVAVLITDSQGTIEYTNPVFLKNSGYQKYEVLGEIPDFLKSEEIDNQNYHELWETINSGKIWEGELINKKKNGELYWIRLYISPIVDSAGLITNFVIVSNDITEKKKAEIELITAKEKAEISDKLKSAFLANISHEIRTPMNGILGFAELLKEPDLSTETQTEYLDVIEKSGQRMLNIINDLIDISKIEAGEAFIKLKQVNINKVLKEIHLFFQPETNQKQISLYYNCELSDEESYLLTDYTKLSQVISNLVKNAVKFTKEGSITFGYVKKDNVFSFYVTDTGPGIPEDHQELIFERFRQGKLGIERKQEGAGLGLAISKAYIELLGGKIWIESALQQGTTFRFELPVKSDSDEFLS